MPLATIIQDFNHGDIYAHLSLHLELFLLCSHLRASSRGLARILI